MNKTSWGHVSSWYDDYLGEKDTYQEKVILPNMLRLLESCKGKKLLDIACGQGYFTKRFRDMGITASGADISSELIAIAKRNDKKSSYHVASAEHLSFASDQSFDVSTIILALQNIKSFGATLLESARILVKGGHLFLVLNHPAFRIPKSSEWYFDEKKNMQGRLLYEYMSEKKVEIDMHPGQKSSVKTITFHRPLQVYFKALEKSGFSVLRLEEWQSHKYSVGAKERAENKARKEIPMFLLLKCQKI